MLIWQLKAFILLIASIVQKIRDNSNVFWKIFYIIYVRFKIFIN